MRSPGRTGWWERLEELGQGRDRRSQPLSLPVWPPSANRPLSWVPAGKPPALGWVWGSPPDMETKVQAVPFPWLILIHSSWKTPVPGEAWEGESPSPVQVKLVPTDPHVCPNWETLPTCPGPGHRAENTLGERTHHPQTQQGLWALRAKDLAVAQGGAPTSKYNQNWCWSAQVHAPGPGQLGRTIMPCSSRCHSPKRAPLLFFPSHPASSQ